MTSLEKEMESRLSNRVLACPLQGKWTSFQLVDESGSGEPYSGLSFTAIDSEGVKYSGNLDTTGAATVTDHSAGPVAILFDQQYEGLEKYYAFLQVRPHYDLKITELQVRAEQTRYLNQNSTRTRTNPAQDCADEFLQVEVRHLVKHVSHLPPEVYRHYPHSQNRARTMGEHGKLGVALMPQKHTVLEVRPLRALRPMLSTDPEFCALNLYQLALMATLSYCPFGQQPDGHPVKTTTVSFPIQPSVGNWFGDALAKADELWRVDAGQKSAFYPLYEDVPYSKRLEIVPFDPDLYEVNRLNEDVEQEHPANIHFLDDRTQGAESTDTQAFITHNDELILIAVRGTYELMADGIRDADAFQVPFEDTDSKVHRGFYEAAQKAKSFVVKYVNKFYTGQKLIICGHSLGGAVALLLSEMLRREQNFGFNLQLYTYGAPRAGDANFVKGAEDLVHHRVVNHNDPVPSVPGRWTDTKAGVFTTGLALTFFNVPAGLSVFFTGVTNWTGQPYDHHGKLQHFMPVEFSDGNKSAILWEPGCDTITQHAACSLALQQKNGLPHRSPLLQIFHVLDHLMADGYVPACWAVLLRWQAAHEKKRSRVTDLEFEMVAGSLARVTTQLRDIERGLPARSDAYVRTQENNIRALGLEKSRIAITVDRLKRVREERVTAHALYGSLLEQPEQLKANVARWLAHPENKFKDPFAMAPEDPEGDALTASIYGHTIGAPHTLDIDSFC